MASVSGAGSESAKPATTAVVTPRPPPPAPPPPKVDAKPSALSTAEKQSLDAKGVTGQSGFDSGGTVKAASTPATPAATPTTPAPSDKPLTGTLNVEFKYEGKDLSTELKAVEGKLFYQEKEVGKVGAKQADGSYAVDVLGQATTATVKAEVNPRPKEVFGLGSPGSFTSAELVPRDVKVDTLVSVAKEADKVAVREHFGKASDADVDKAFTTVIDATQAPGEKDLTFGQGQPVGRGQIPKDAFSCHLSVGPDLSVNGGTLPADQALSVGAQLANLSPDERQKALAQVGVSQRWLDTSSMEQQHQALVQVELARQKGQGDASITLPPGSKPIGRGGLRDPGGELRFSVDDKGRVAKQGSTDFAEPAAQASLQKMAERETALWPNGKPEDYVVKHFEPGKDVNPFNATQKSIAESTTRQEKVDTVVSVFRPEQQVEVRRLLEKGGDYGSPPAPTPGKPALPWSTPSISDGKVTDASLEKAFGAVLEARKTPGKKTLELDLTPSRTVVTQGWGDGGADTRMEELGKPVHLSTSVDVSADGKVNGKELPVDLHARLATELTRVPQDLKDQSLRDAGLPQQWMLLATPQQKELALAKLREATMSPGTKELDLGFDHTSTISMGDSGDSTSTQRIDGKLTLNVDEKGLVDGKPLTIETSLATSLMMEQLPMAEKRAMMARLGFGQDPCRNVTADQAGSLLTRAAMTTRAPGDHRLEARVGGDRYQVALKVGANGEIEGSGAGKIEEPKKQSGWKKYLGPVLTVVSIVFPVTAPFISVIQAGMAVANGAKGLNLVGAVLGGVAGVGGISGAISGAVPSWVSTVSNAATLVNGVSGAVQGIKNGDPLALFSSAVTLAGAAGSLAGDSNFVSSDLKFMGKAAGIGSSIQNGDTTGALGGAFGLAYDLYQAGKLKPDGTSTAPADARQALEEKAKTWTSDKQYDGALVGANGKTYPPGTPLSEVPAVEPEGGARNQKTIIYTNGILTELTGQYQSLKQIADLTGSRVVGVHNATEKIAIDGLQVFMEKAGGSDVAITSLAQTVYTELEAGRSVQLMGHSQGGLVTAQALETVQQRLLVEKGLTKADAQALMSKVEVETFGAASYSYPDGPSYTHNVNRLDPVPMALGISEWNPFTHPGSGAKVNFFTESNGLNIIANHAFEEVYLKHRQAPQ